MTFNPMVPYVSYPRNTQKREFRALRWVVPLDAINKAPGSLRTAHLNCSRCGEELLVRSSRGLVRLCCRNTGCQVNEQDEEYSTFSINEPDNN